jgi:hypothetical protein
MRSLVRFVKPLIAWALSLPVYAAILVAWNPSNGAAQTDFVEALLGIGILLVMPGFLFTLIVGWPTMSVLVALRPAWLVPLVAGPVFALLMWVLAALMLADDWRGAGDALIGYAAALGVVWGCLNLVTRPAD